MTAAPTYTWDFVADLFGDRVPKILTLASTVNTQCKVGTLMSLVSGQVLPTLAATGKYIIGIAVQDVLVNPAANDPIKVAVLAPGMLIKGTASSTAAGNTGFQSKVTENGADGSLNPAGVTNGGLSVLRTENAGLTVYCVVTKGAIIA